MQADDSSGFDNEEIDRAIALSLVEVDQKGKKVIGKVAYLQALIMSIFCDCYWEVCT